MKVCSKCKEEKEYSLFSKSKSGKNGLDNQCKLCRKKYRDSIPKEIKNEWKKRYTGRYEYKYKYNPIRNRESRERRKEKILEYNINYRRKRVKEDPLFKFNTNVRSLIKETFIRGIGTKKNTKTETILGCTIEEFRLYIESKFTEGMSFENHSINGWHLDHIIPVSTAKTEEEVIKLNHYTNFQPLWAKDNLRKSNKI